MPKFHVTVLLHQWDIKNPNFNATSLRTSGVTHVTLPIMWSRVEVRDGIFDFSYYDPLVEGLITKGFKLILMLDGGGRPEFDDEGQIIAGSSTIPHHIRSRPELLQSDFYGETQLQVSFVHPEAMQSMARFFKKSVSHFGARFREDIFAFGVGIQSELEIKYGQFGYRWRDYSDLAKSKFQAEFGLRQPPVVDYGRTIAVQNPPDASFSEWIKFRERTLVESVTSLSNIIRSAGFYSMGYFGEFFTSHDAIMGLGVIGELGGVLDAAAMDYNFYDGWSNQPDPYKVPMLANYARHIGFSFVFGGFYLERWRQPVGEPGSQVDPAIFPVVAQSLFECRWHRLIDGIEIGGFGDVARDLRVLRAPMLNAAIHKAPERPENPERKQIGLFASHQTFEYFVGEHDHDINIHSEALTRSFAMLSACDQYETIIISEKSLTHRPDIIKALDAIYVPHQPVLSDETRDALVSFAQNKLLIQDVRLGEWDENGYFRGDWMHDLFGIGGLEWVSEGGGWLMVNGEPNPMPTSPKQNTCALFAARGGAKICAPSVEHRDLGLVLTTPHTIALGYIPALVEGRYAEVWQTLFFDTLANALTA